MSEKMTIEQFVELATVGGRFVHDLNNSLMVASGNIGFIVDDAEPGTQIHEDATAAKKGLQKAIKEASEIQKIIRTIRDSDI